MKYELTYMTEIPEYHSDDARKFYDFVNSGVNFWVERQIRLLKTREFGLNC